MYIVFTLFFLEFMLQKFLTFANYAKAVLVWKKVFSFAPIMPKSMLAQSAMAYLGA